MLRFEVRAETITAATMPAGNAQFLFSTNVRQVLMLLRTKWDPLALRSLVRFLFFGTLVLPNSSIRSYVIQSHKKAR